MPTLRRGAVPLLGAAVLLLCLPACTGPPVAPAVPLHGEAASRTSPRPEDARGAAIPPGEEPSAGPAAQPPAAADRSHPGGPDGPEALRQPWQARHGGSCGQPG